MSEDKAYLLEAFMNLIDVCARKGIEFDVRDGFDLDDCKQTVNSFLANHGYDQKSIDDVWTGEIQLTSS